MSLNALIKSRGSDESEPSFNNGWLIGPLDRREH